MLHVTLNVVAASKARRACPGFLGWEENKGKEEEENKEDRNEKIERRKKEGKRKKCITNETYMSGLY